MNHLQPFSLKLTDNSKKVSKRLISLTPLIDGGFILLLFFMLASSFIEWSSVKVNVASVSQTQGFDEQQSVLLIVSDDALWLNGNLIEGGELVNTVNLHLQAHPLAKIHVQPKEQASLQAVIKTLDILQAGGIHEFTLVPDQNWEAID